MGLRNGLIPTSAISSSSQKSSDESLDTVRLGNSQLWVAARNDTAPWIEIQFSSGKSLFVDHSYITPKLLFPGNAKILTGLEIRGEITEIIVQYDTLTSTAINYSENVCIASTLSFCFSFSSFLRSIFSRFVVLQPRHPPSAPFISSNLCLVSLVFDLPSIEHSSMLRSRLRSNYWVVPRVRSFVR